MANPPFPSPANVTEATRLFLDPKTTRAFLSCHRRWLCAVLVSLPKSSSTLSPAAAEGTFVALHHALQMSPHFWTFARQCFEKSNPPFKRLLPPPDEDEAEPRTKMARIEVVDGDITTEQILSASLTFAKSDAFFRELWPWSDLLKSMNKLSPESVWLALECVGVTHELAERQKLKIAAEFMSPDQYHALSCAFSERLYAEGAVASSLLLGRHQEDSSRPQNSEESGLTYVGGIPIQSHRASSALSMRLPVMLPSRETLLKRLGLCVSSGQPVILAGPSGSGKTTAVEYLAGLSGKEEFVDFHRLQISDETDARTLLGGYTCSTTPGAFHWMPGVLTESVASGHWLLLEDVDQAADDVLSVLLSFIESRMLHVPARDLRVRPAPGFQLFLTRGERDVSWRPSCQILRLDAYSVVELSAVAESLYPEFKGAVGKMTKLMVMLNAKHRVSQSRLLTVRDLLSWCQRCCGDKGDAPPPTRQVYFEEALNVFCNHLKSMADKKFRAELLARLFQIDKSVSDFFVEEKNSAVVLKNDCLQVGRATLDIASDAANAIASDSFCMTSQASNLMEFLVGSIALGKPVLLVGETGVGKTTVVQYLAKLTNSALHVVNVCDNSESSDLFGSFKPIDVSVRCRALIREFGLLCNATYSKSKNTKFLANLHDAALARRWTDIAELLLHASSVAISDKKRVTDHVLLDKWSKLQKDCRELSKNTAVNSFAFVEGALTAAVRNGHWILLDEVNLAEKEALLSVCSLFSSCEALRLNDGAGTVLQRHPDFRLFCCMNPSTDVGKKELPQNFRTHFAEFFLDEPENEKDLLLIVKKYLEKLTVKDTLAFKLVTFYRTVKELSKKRLSDGTGKTPSFSLRTLCRALSIASKNMCHNVERSLLEAFSICFLTELDRSSYSTVLVLLYKHIYGSAAKSGLDLPKFTSPVSKEKSVQIEGYWLRCGDSEVKVKADYILTETVRRNLKDVARVVSFSQFPILLQGETSVGKTSLVKYLADATGNRLLRINNHEHTDVQEYVGSYGSDADGNFHFREGFLAQAMRQGFWLILDELNLASTEILEALNRVLDDNRELFITETQTRIAAHPNFRVFATQNPVGLYGGRKVLSRAFRNRFVEIHFDELQTTELAEVIEKKSSIPATMSKKIVRVMSALQLQRKASETFRGKRGFITLRDLFRWASRYARCSQGQQNGGGGFYDWDQHMAEEGFLVLAGRCRNDDEVTVIRESIEKVFKKKLPVDFYSLQNSALVLKAEMEVIRGLNCDLALTSTTVRMMALLLHSFKYGEPVLLIGGTGLGKTSICQAVSEHLGRQLYSVNCHLNTDASDFLGSLRPCRTEDSTRLFEWQDGPLIAAMLAGGVFLLDEISLADDSVVERINSALEEDSALVLPEKPHEDPAEVVEVRASEHFRLCATMNPSGDFGKKELSPALRNRFMEIWCPAYSTRGDLTTILKHLLRGVLPSNLVDFVVDFFGWINVKLSPHYQISYRDIRAWTSFVTATLSFLDPNCSVVHGTCLVVLDGLETFDFLGDRNKVSEIKKGALDYFRRNMNHNCSCLDWISSNDFGKAVPLKLERTEKHLQIGEFSLPTSINKQQQQQRLDHLLEAPTVTKNAFRVIRGLQIERPVLLEGPPGVGKSALVEALARATGNQLTRINLSEQTDIADLFGTDLPAAPTDDNCGSSQSMGKFSWQDGPFLAAMKAGHWILLDELNLATQSVLEGLNACLDHRGEVYIPEVDRRFFVDKTTKIFATQNPYKDGSGRKGLPKSFLNRFVKVYMSSLLREDVIRICLHKFPTLREDRIGRLVDSANRLVSIPSIPWTLNLRDLMRWCGGVEPYTESPAEGSMSCQLGYLLFASRFRTEKDREKVGAFLAEFFNSPYNRTLGFSMTPDVMTVGNASICRRASSQQQQQQVEAAVMMGEQYPALESLVHCVNNNWIPILVGSQGCGKTTMVVMLAALVGQSLSRVTLNSLSDTSELLGSFEQTNKRHRVVKCKQALLHLLSEQELGESLLSREQIAIRANEIDRLGQLEEDLEEEIIALERFARYVSSQYPKCAESVEDIRRSLSLLSRTATDDNNFEWVDSALVEAVAKGKWLLVDNANFCSASVLDRLNALFEPGGTLVLGEAGCPGGKVRSVSPHPNFRVFLTVDPKHGELSSAMRNRCVEIFIDGDYVTRGKRLLTAEVSPGQFPTLTEAKLFRQRFELLLACGENPSSAALVSADHSSAMLQLQQQQQEELLPLLPISPLRVSDIVSHPASFLAVFQLEGLKEVTNGGSHKIVVKSLLTFSRETDLSARLSLLHRRMSLSPEAVGALETEMKLMMSEKPDARLFWDDAKRNLVRLELLLAVPGLLPVAGAQTVELAEILEETDRQVSDILSLLQQRFHEMKNDISDQLFLSLWKIVGVLNELRSVFGDSRDTEEVTDKIKILKLVIRGYWAKLSELAPQMGESCLMLLHCNNASPSLKIGQVSSVWPVIRDVRNYKVYKSFLKYAAEHNPYAADTLDDLSDVLGCHSGFTASVVPFGGGKLTHLDFFAMLLQDYLVNARNLLVLNGSVPAGQFQISPLYPLPLKMLLENVPAQQHPVNLRSASGIQLHDLLGGKWLRMFGNNEDVGPACISAIVSLLFAENDGFCRMFELSSFHGVSKCLSNTKDFLLKNRNLLKSRCLDVMLLDANSLAAALNPAGKKVSSGVNYEGHVYEIPSHIAQQSTLPAELKMLSKQVTEMLSQFRAGNERRKPYFIGRMKLLSGLFYFHLSVYCDVDTKELLEEESRLLLKERTEALLTLQADYFCYTLQPVRCSQGVSQHGLSKVYGDLICDNEERVEAIRAEIPTRIESFQQLRLRLRQLGESLMNITHVTEMMEKMEKGDVVEEEMETWQANLVRAAEDLEAKFSSYQDVWNLSVLGVTEVLSGATILRSHWLKRRDGQRRLVAWDRVGQLLSVEEGDGYHLVQQQQQQQQQQNGNPFPVDESKQGMLYDRAVQTSGKKDEEFSDFVLTSGVVKKQSVFLSLYKDIIRETSPLTLSEFDSLLHPCHVKALSLCEQERRVKDADMNGICGGLVPDLLGIRKALERDLLSKWPENPLLLDIGRGIDQVLAHSLTDGKLEFQLSLENLATKISDWNKVAHVHVKVTARPLTDFLSGWRKNELAAMRKVNDVLQEDCRKRQFAKARLMFVLCENICRNRNIRRRRMWLGGTLMLFVLSSSPREFEPKLEALAKLCKMYSSGVNEKLSRLLGTVVEIFTQFRPEVTEQRSAHFKAVEKLASDAFKLCNVNRVESCLKISRERKKLERDCLTLLSASMTPFTAKFGDNNTAGFDIDSWKTKLANSEVKNQSDVFVFVATDGTVLGTSSDMCVKARSHLRSIRLATFESSLDVDTVESLVECLQDIKDTSGKELYAVTKSIEALFKSLRAEGGLSFRLGVLFDLNAATVMSECQIWKSNVLSCCLAQFDSMLGAFKKPEKHVSPSFLERARGFSSHLLLSVLKISGAVGVATRDLELLRVKLNSLAGFGSNRRRQMLRTVKTRLDKIVGVLTEEKGDFKSLSCLTERLETMLQFNLVMSESEVTFVLTQCDDSILALLADYSKIKKAGNVQLYLDYCSLRTLLSSFLHILRKISAPNTTAINPEFKERCLATMKKSLNATRRVKSYLVSCSSSSEGKTFCEQISQLSDCLSGLALNKRLQEVTQLCAFADLLGKYEDQDCMVSLIDEFRGVISTYLDGCQMLTEWSEAVVLPSSARYLFLLLQTFTIFCSKKYATEEEKPDDEESGGPKGKAADGCGLGEGEGEKSTLEGVDSEDLFENQTGEGEEERNKDGKKEENEDFVDFSEDLNAPAEDMSEKEEDDDDDDGKDAGEEDEKFEEGQAEEEDDRSKKDEELLDSKDWDTPEDEEGKEEEEEEEKNRPEPKQSDALTEEKEMENLESNDAVQDSDMDKRERLPDQEEQNEMDTDMKDEDHTKEHQEPVIEDLDMDDDFDIDEPMDENDEGMSNDPDEDAVDRQPDFEDAPLPDDDAETDKTDSSKVDEGVDETPAAENDQQPLGNRGNQRCEESGKDEQDKDSAGQEARQQEDEMNTGEAEAATAASEHMQLPDDSDDKAVDDQIANEEDPRLECEEAPLACKDASQVVPSRNAIDLQTSKLYAHLEKEEEDKSAASVMANVPFENLKELSLKVEEEEKEQKENSDESVSKKEMSSLTQSLNPKTDRNSRPTVETSLVSRGSHSEISTSYSGIDEDDAMKMETETNGFASDETGVTYLSEHLSHWAGLCSSTQELSQHLTEQLRLIIEPTKTTRLRGDYATGKRLNMKKIIPYIASNFRKDKIWLRRTRPSKRDCEVVVALDDSSSMADNRVQEVAFRALATICQSLSLLEVGRLGVVRFGEEASLVSPLKQTFSATDGANILSKFSFQQPVTKLLELMSLTGRVFSSSTTAPLSKLLIILSDGKGVFSEGKRQVLDAVRNARLQGTFVVFMILEAPQGDDAKGGESVLDVRMPVFDEKNNLLAIEPYMEHFPFPFYIILRELASLPSVLSDALRQWFELVSAS